MLSLNFLIFTDLTTPSKGSLATGNNQHSSTTKSTTVLIEKMSGFFLLKLYVVDFVFEKLTRRFKFRSTNFRCKHN